MANERDYQELFDRLAGLREKVTDIHSADFISNPQLADALMKQIDDLLLAAQKQDEKTAPPADKGLAQLAGVGPDAADQFGKARIPQGVQPYDDQITSERIVAVRERAYDPSFGSIAIVRRSGLDLRNNLKFTSFGHLNVMRVEVMQLLEEAFKILGADDVRNLFGTDSAWDTVEEILVRYFNER